MKTKFSVALTTLALVGLTAVVAADFTVNVKIGSASAGTSLTFGAGTETAPAFPPLSLMFGVKDVYLANPANVGSSAGVSGDMSRLSVDVRSGATQWVIVANSDTTLYFEKSGSQKLYYGAKVAKDATSTEFAGGELGDSLSVSAGTVYTISTTAVAEANVAEVAEDPANATVYAQDNEGEFAGSWSGDGAATTIQVAATDEGVYFTDGTTYYGLDGSTTTTKPSDATAIVTVDGATISAVSNYALSVSGTPSLSYEGTSNAKPFTTTVINGDEKLAAITWIVKTFGTLDFDQNGVVNGNDATFFYNYVSLGGADFVEEITPYADPTITDDLDGDAARALEFFKSKENALRELSLVAADTVNDLVSLSDSATFFYNYMSLGGADFPEEITPYTSRSGNSNQDLIDAQEAIDKIAELMK